MGNPVAPYAGAWIETWANMQMPRGATWSLPTRERGLKRHRRHGRALPFRRRSLRGSVD